MRFSTKIRYGIRAMVEVAKADQEVGIFQKDIAANQKISYKYLDQLVHALKAAGLIISIKGKKSGYRLTRKASKITMLDIYNAFEPEINVCECLSEFITCEMEEVCNSNSFWRGLNKAVVDYFAKATLQDLVDKKDF